MTDLAHATYGGTKDAASFLAFLNGWDEAAELERLRRAGIIWVPQDRLPERLRSIHDAPRGLFVRANPNATGLLTIDDVLADSPAVAVVGARACTDYGAHVAGTSSMRLAQAGATIVSGLARGIDAHAHRGALERPAETWESELDGRTIAVLGCGIDVTYPRAHTQLAADITARGGLVVSEYPPGVPPAPWRFPARNRIVAGLSDAVLVVEARERSGSLITADLALREGRPIFVVPGEITSSASAGSNRLLRRGARPFLGDPDEIADVLIEREQRPRTLDVHRMTDDELRARVNEFTQDDPPPYDGPSRLSEHDRDDIDAIMNGRGDWFSAQLLRLIAKSDHRNRAALATVYPDHVAAYETWVRQGKS